MSAARRAARVLLGLGAAGALAGLSMLAQAYAPARLNRQRFTLPGLAEPLSAALLSDLHFGPLIGARQLRGWVDRTMQARPQLILLAGDLLDDRGALPAPELLRELARLRAPLGVWAVWGNHDYGAFGRVARPGRGRAGLGGATPHPDWARRRETFEHGLERAGVRVLTNAGALIRPDLYLAGVDDLMRGEPELEAALSGAPPGAATLLMSHTPDLLPRIAELARVPGLTVCGHTHGGQVRFPLIGAPVVPSRYGQRFAQGRLTQPAPAFVSRGLGLSGLPLRNLCPPEVVLLALEPA